MGALESDQGKRSILGADNLVGREPSASLCLDEQSVSWRHASVRWTGRIWELQDLASMNGTSLDGERIATGARVPLRLGCRVRFGDGPEWTLVDAEGPVASALDLDTGERLFASDGLLALPSGDQPLVSIYRRADGSWVGERPDATWEPHAMEIVTVEGHRFRFEPDSPVHATSASRIEQPTTATMALEFIVSRNEEHVDITIVHRDQRIALRPRAHGYLLLTLARLRAKDQTAGGLPEKSQGWVEQERLARMLATGPTQLAVDIYRARRQFGEAGVADAVQIVERRPTSHELRIGVPALSIAVA
jgi:hypothetical protein